MGLNYRIEHEPYIIFFTEPREIYVNQEIIKGILPELKKKGRGLCLKLHPGDSTSNYSEFDVKIVSNYAESLTGNICIARKSTMLLEAIHNNSTAIAIITNPKDQTMFDNFPSLNTSKINKAYSVKELLDQIDKYL